MNTKADLVLSNGTILTMDSAIPMVSAVAVVGNKIAWLGDQQHIQSWVGPNTQVIDLKGAFVHPGFIDSHAHIFYTGHTKKLQINLTSTQSKDEILKLVREKTKEAKRGEWIFGYGWDEHVWPEIEYPSAKDLDDFSPNNPIFLRRIDTHLSWVNTVALKLAHIDKSTPDPVGGKIYHDKEGNPTGILVDAASRAVYDVIPPYTPEQALDLVQHAFQEAVQKGVTSIHNAATFDYDLAVFKYLAAQNKLPVRVHAMLAVLSKNTPLEGLKPESFGPFLEVRCLKMFMDGALGSRGAKMKSEYHDDPGNTGLQLWQDTDLLKVLDYAKKMGFQVGTHAIGDFANYQILNAYEKIGVKGLRWRVEHVQVLDKKDMNRFASLGVIASMQPLHLSADMHWFESRVGLERSQQGAFLWRSLIDSGAIIAGGSDSPVVDINPLWGIYSAITRKDLKGLPKEGWFPKEVVTREEALKMYTINGAYAAFRENELGSITVGKLADIVVLPDNILTCEPEKLIDMKVLYTIIDGKIVYEVR